MKKQKSTTINISEVSSSDDDESQIAKPRIDSDDESSPHKPIKVKRLKTSPLQDSPIIQPNKSISKESPQKYLVQGANFKKLQKRQRNLVLIHSSIPKEKIPNTWLNTTTKRFTLVLQKLKIT